MSLENSLFEVGGLKDNINAVHTYSYMADFQKLMMVVHGLISVVYQVDLMVVLSAINATCWWMCMHVTYVGMTYSQRICCEVRQPLEKLNHMDSTMRSKEKAHEKVKLELYGMSLKKVLIVPSEGGVPVEEVKGR
eukprot:Gb_31818 [translate_table: standard]